MVFTAEERWKAQKPEAFSPSDKTYGSGTDPIVIKYIKTGDIDYGLINENFERMRRRVASLESDLDELWAVTAAFSRQIIVDYPGVNVLLHEKDHPMTRLVRATARANSTPDIPLDSNPDARSFADDCSTVQVWKNSEVLLAEGLFKTTMERGYLLELDLLTETEMIDYRDEVEVTVDSTRSLEIICTFERTQEP